MARLRLVPPEELCDTFFTGETFEHRSPMNDEVRIPTRLGHVDFEESCRERGGVWGVQGGMEG